MSLVIQLHCGDCLEVLKRLDAASVDAVVTDPPYGARRPSARRLAGDRFSEVAGNDGVHGEWILEAFRVTRDGGALYSFSPWDRFCDWHDEIKNGGFRVRSCIVWDKLIHGLADLETCWAPRHELILFAAKRRHEFVSSRPIDVIRAQRLSPDKLVHPYQKPINVIEALLRASALPGDTILDPYMGSGTTGVAAVRMGMNFIGIEIDPGYFAIAEKRINAELNRHPLFEPPQKAQQLTFA